MKSNYKKLAPYIRQIDERNSEDIHYELLGVSVDKCFIKSIANTVGTDWRGYKKIKRGQFCYIPDTSRRGDKIGIALQSDYDIALVSQAYTVFEVSDTAILLPEYLNLWFKRTEFDRYARFHSHGSVREIFDWEELCNVTLPIPSIEEQQKIVDAYNIIERRIAIKRQINDNLESQAQALFNEQFGTAYVKDTLPNDWKYTTIGEICSVKGGKRLPAECELTDTPTTHPYIRVRDVGINRYVCLNGQYQYIEEDTYNQISRYIVNTDDIIISIVGTIGLIGKIHSSLNGANLTENCVKLTNLQQISTDYLYYTLMYKKRIREIDLLTVGAVQAKLPIYNILSMKIILPPKEKLFTFQTTINTINKHVESNIVEIERLNNLKNLTLTKLSR